jgi:hypothetical protein
MQRSFLLLLFLFCTSTLLLKTEIYKIITLSVLYVREFLSCCGTKSGLWVENPAKSIEKSVRKCEKENELIGICVFGLILDSERLGGLAVERYI